MTIEDFYSKLSGLLIYIPAFLLVFIFYFYTLRKHFINLTDPLLMEIIGNFCSSLTVIVLYLNKYISDSFFVNYILSEIFLLMGLLCVRPYRLSTPKEKKIIVETSKNNYIYFYIFLLFSIVFIITQSFIYLKLGIPLFSSKRGKFYENVGYLSHIVNISKFVLVYFSFIFIFRIKKIKIPILFQIFFWFAFIFLLISLLLNGSKAGFMNFLVFLSVFIVFSSRLGLDINFKSINKYINTSIILILFLFIVIVVVRDRSNLTYAVNHFFMRLWAYGDVYVLGYVNDNIDKVKIDSPLIYLGASNVSGFINNVFGTDISRPDAIGKQLVDIINGFKLSVGVGPNARYNILGYLFFGFYGNLIYSFFTGFAVSFIKNKIIYFLPRNILGGLFYSILVTCSVFFITDLILAITYLFYFVIIFPPIFILAYFLAGITVKQ